MFRYVLNISVILFLSLVTSDEKKAASRVDSKASVNIEASVNIATDKQKKRALNRMYYHVHTQTKDVSAKTGKVCH